MEMIDPSLISQLKYTNSNVYIININMFKNKCYSFAREVATSSNGGYYVEGMISIETNNSIENSILSVGHAWIVNTRNQIIDGALNTSSRCGIEIPVAMFQHYIHQKSFADVYQTHDIFPFIRAYKSVVGDDFMTKLHHYNFISETRKKET